MKRDFCRQAVPRSHHALAEGEITQIKPQSFLLQLPGLSPQSRGVSHLKEVTRLNALQGEILYANTVSPLSILQDNESIFSSIWCLSLYSLPLRRFASLLNGQYPAGRSNYPSLNLYLPATNITSSMLLERAKSGQNGETSLNRELRIGLFE